MGLASLLRGLWLLRHPDLVWYLGNLRSSIFQIEQITKKFPEVTIDADVLIQGWPYGDLVLEGGVRIEKGSMLALGDAFNGYGKLAIGRNTWIGQYNNFRLAKDTFISIGNDCLISQFCSLIAANHSIDKKVLIRENKCDLKKVSITVHNDVWLGVGVAILPGVVIGNGAVVGANSVVTKSIPAYEIWAGSPACKIGDRV